MYFFICSTISISVNFQRVAYYRSGIYHLIIVVIFQFQSTYLFKQNISANSTVNEWKKEMCFDQRKIKSKFRVNIIQCYKRLQFNSGECERKTLAK